MDASKFPTYFSTTYTQTLRHAEQVLSMQIGHPHLYFEDLSGSRTITAEPNHAAKVRLRFQLQPLVIYLHSKLSDYYFRYAKPH